MAPTILVVDDQDVLRDVIRIALEDAGYRVLEASTPSKALSITQRDAAIDLLLADVVMPEMDAFELADRIAEDVPGIRVLYTSGYTDAREEGPFIRKPFTPTELVAKVEAVLASE